MARIFCFRHPRYDGQLAPDLACRACCAIFLAAIKEDREKQSGEDAKAWEDLDLEKSPNKFVPAAHGHPTDDK